MLGTSDLSYAWNFRTAAERCGLSDLFLSFSYAIYFRTDGVTYEINEKKMRTTFWIHCIAKADISCAARQSKKDTIIDLSTGKSEFLGRAHLPPIAIATDNFNVLSNAERQRRLASWRRWHAGVTVEEKCEEWLVKCETKKQRIRREGGGAHQISIYIYIYIHSFHSAKKSIQTELRWDHSHKTEITRMNVSTFDKKARPRDTASQENEERRREGCLPSDSEVNCEHIWKKQKGSKHKFTQICLSKKSTPAKEDCIGKVQAHSQRSQALTVMQLKNKRVEQSLSVWKTNDAATHLSLFRVLQKEQKVGQPAKTKINFSDPEWLLQERTIWWAFLLNKKALLWKEHKCQKKNARDMIKNRLMIHMIRAEKSWTYSCGWTMWGIPWKQHKRKSQNRKMFTATEPICLSVQLQPS